MGTVAIIVFTAVGFVAGLYVASQISEGIENRIQHKEFMKNLNEFDRKEKK